VTASDVGEGPFDPPQDGVTSSPLHRAWPAVRAVLPWAAPVTVAATIAQVLATTELQVPSVPLGFVFAAVCLLPIAAALVWWTADRGWWLIGCLAMPVVFAASFPIPALVDPTGTLDSTLDTLAFQALWMATVGPCVTAVWLRVPVSRLPGFVAVVGIKNHLLVVAGGCCLIFLPLFLLFALFEVVAARDPTNAVWRRSLRAVVEHSNPWLVMVLGILAVSVVAMGVVVVWMVATGLGDTEVFLRSPLPRLPFPVELATGLLNNLTLGATTAAAAGMLAAEEHVREGRAEPV
jgi:hypothetical protein